MTFLQMNSKDNKQNFFTLSASYIVERLEETHEQIIGSEIMLQHFLNSQTNEHKSIIPMVVDILWLNFGIVKLLTPFIENPVFVDNPETKEKDYMLDDVALLSLQAMMASRHYANTDLNRLSYSIMMH